MWNNTKETANWISLRRTNLRQVQGECLLYFLLPLIIFIMCIYYLHRKKERKKEIKKERKGKKERNEGVELDDL